MGSQTKLTACPTQQNKRQKLCSWIQFGSFIKMVSRLLVGKVLLCFIIPATFSLHNAATGGPEDCLPWLKFWVVLSVGLFLELFLESLEGIALTCVKVVLILWCLAPLEYNGADILFTYVLIPLHQGVTMLASRTVDVIFPLLDLGKDVVWDSVDIVMDWILYPVFNFIIDAAQFCGSLAALVYEYIASFKEVSFQKMSPPISCAIAMFQHLLSKTAELFLLGFEKVAEFLANTPEFATTFFNISAEFATASFNTGYDFAIAAALRIAELSILTFDNFVAFVIFIFERTVVFASVVSKSLMTTVEDGVSYYKHNEKNPRLFSEALKQMVFQ